jgi:hypothetical protein
MGGGQRAFEGSIIAVPTRQDWRVELLKRRPFGANRCRPLKWRSRPPDMVKADRAQQAAVLKHEKEKWAIVIILGDYI